MRCFGYVLIVLAVVNFSSNQSYAVSCHCFQDRTFDLQRPDAADSYFLATTQNSLLAAALNVPKKSIVQAKMGGADADLLWVAYYVSDRSGLEISELIELYASSASWPRFLEKILSSAEKFDRPFVVSLAKPSNLAVLADGAFRSVMTGQLGIDLALMDAMKKSGAARKEQILAIFISQLLGESPLDILDSVNRGGKSWGMVLSETGLDPKQIEPTWRKLIRMQGHES